jgi:microcystin-dependent protein
MGEPFVGEIRIFAGTFAPAGWAMCAGQLMPISQNDTLFNLIGTTYGGDGEETFAVPNIQSRLPMHAGQGPGISQNYQLGETGGVESVTLSTQQIPIHNHAMLANAANGQQPQPQGAFLSQTNPGFSYVAASTPHVNLNAGSLAPVGGSQPHDNMQPFLVLTFIISLFGIFPTQN